MAAIRGGAREEADARRAEANARWDAKQAAANEQRAQHEQEMRDGGDTAFEVHLPNAALPSSWCAAQGCYRRGGPGGPPGRLGLTIL